MVRRWRRGGSDVPTEGCQMRYEFSPWWHRFGKLGAWRLYDNTLSYAVNRRYLRYGRAQCGGGSSWPMRNGEPAIVASAVDSSVAGRCSETISKGLESGTLTRSRD